MATLAAATELLRLLGDPTRVRLLALLDAEELTVAELTRITRLSQSRVSTHLGKLREAGLVRDRRAGAASYYRSLGEAQVPEEARRFWRELRRTARDPLLEDDAARMRSVLSRRDGPFRRPESVAGSMERRYSPGRTWEAALRGLIGLARLGDVLDIASGDGALASLVAPRARSVTCIDISPTPLAASRERMAVQEVSCVRHLVADMHALPFADACFDHVLMLACLSYSSDPAAAIREAARVLRPGGNLVAATLERHRHRDRVAGYNHLQAGFEPAPLRRLLELAGLSVELCEVTSRERRPPHFQVITVHAGK